jgi:hypothetical protein
MYKCTSQFSLFLFWRFDAVRKIPKPAFILHNAFFNDLISETYKQMYSIQTYVISNSCSRSFGGTTKCDFKFSSSPFQTNVAVYKPFHISYFQKFMHSYKQYDQSRLQIKPVDKAPPVKSFDSEKFYSQLNNLTTLFDQHKYEEFMDIAAPYTTEIFQDLETSVSQCKLYKTFF